MESSKLNIIIETKPLVHALSFANSVIEKRNAVAELSNIKLSVKDNFLEIIATNMDLYLSQTLGIQEFSSGETTVSINTLMDIVKKIPDKEIKLNIQEDSDMLEITGKNCQFSLLTLPVNKFPMVGDVKAESMLKISCRDFAKLIEYTLFSTSSDENRYNINGIYLHVKDGKFCSASTDGHRVSISSTIIESKTLEFGVILPQKTSEEILKIIRDPKNIQSDIEILLSINKIKFICGDIELVSKLIDGVFPGYSDFIPKENNNKLTINTKLLAETIDRVSSITVDKFRAIKIILTKDMVEITASGESRGVGKEVILSSEEDDNFCQFDSDSDITIGFNPKYLIDVFNAIKLNHHKVEIYFNDESSPILIKAPNNDLDSFIIMPVKV